MLSGSLVRAATAFLSVLVLMRLIEPEGFGRFYIAAATIGLVITLLSPRLNIWLITIPDDELDEARLRHVVHAIAMEAIILTVIALGWLLAAGLFTPLNVMLALTLTVRLYVNNHVAIFERSQRYVRITLLETVAHLVAHTGAVVLAALGVGEAALYFRELILVVVIAVWLQRLGGLRWFGLVWVAPREWLAIIKQVWGLWAEGLAESLFSRLEVLVVSAIGGDKGAGYYSQARRLVMLPHQLLQPLTGRMALNWFSRDRSALVRRNRRRRLMRVSAALLGLAVAGNLLLAGSVVPWVFGPKWEPVVPIMWALSGMLATCNLHATHKMFLMATRQLRALLWSRVALMAGLLGGVVPLLWGTRVELWVFAAGVSAGYIVALVVTSVGIWSSERGLTAAGDAPADEAASGQGGRPA